MRNNSWGCEKFIEIEKPKPFDLYYFSEKKHDKFLNFWI